MSSLKPILANPAIRSRKIRFYWLLMSASCSLMLGRGDVQIEPDGSASLLNIENMDILLSWLRKMTECWIDKFEASSNMRKFIGKYRTSASLVHFLRFFYVRRFFSVSEDGTPLKKKWVCICLFRSSFLSFISKSSYPIVIRIIKNSTSIIKFRI